MTTPTTGQKTLSEVLPNLCDPYDQYRRLKDTTHQTDAAIRLASQISMLVELEDRVLSGPEDDLLDLLATQTSSFMSWENLLGNATEDENVSQETIAGIQATYLDAAIALADAFHEGFPAVVGWSGNCMSWCRDNRHPETQPCREDWTVGKDYQSGLTVEMVGMPGSFVNFNICGQDFNPTQVDLLYRTMKSIHDQFKRSCAADVHVSYPSPPNAVHYRHDVAPFAGEHASWCPATTHTGTGYDKRFCALTLVSTADLELAWVCQPGEELFMVFNGIKLDGTGEWELLGALPAMASMASKSQAVDVEGREWGGYEL